MKKYITPIFGFLITPLIASIVLSAVEMAKVDPFDIATVLGWMLIFYCYTLGVTLVIALPVYLLLKHFNKVRWWSAVLTGLFCGALMAFIAKPLTILVIPIGGFSAFVFWLIWRKSPELPKVSGVRL